MLPTDDEMQWCAWYDDIFIPETAGFVLAHTASFDEETLRLVITCEAYAAECELSRN